MMTLYAYKLQRITHRPSLIEIGNRSRNSNLISLNNFEWNLEENRFMKHFIYFFRHKKLYQMKQHIFVYRCNIRYLDWEQRQYNTLYIPRPHADITHKHSLYFMKSLSICAFPGPRIPLSLSYFPVKYCQVSEFIFFEIQNAACKIGSVKNSNFRRANRLTS